MLVLLLVGQLLLVAAQLPSAGGHDSQLEVACVRVVAPLGRLVNAIAASFGQGGEMLQQRSVLIAQNRQLREENRRLRRQVQQLGDLQGQLQRLAAAHRYVAPGDARLLVADVVYLDYQSWVRTLLLYAPDPEVAVNQAVITADGLVGRVVTRSGPYAKVQLITDRAAGVGAMLERTRRQGLVRGTAPGKLELIYLPRQAEVQPGDRVVTSGVDGVFPRGILIGTVVSVEPGDDLFHRIRLQAAADFGTLDHVYILIRPVVPPDLREAPSAN